MRDFKMVEQEKFLLEERLVYYDKNQGTTADSKGKNDFWRQQDDLRRKIDLLQSDKEYLTKENISLLEKNKRLEDRVILFLIILIWFKIFFSKYEVNFNKLHKNRLF